MNLFQHRFILNIYSICNINKYMSINAIKYYNQKNELKHFWYGLFQFFWQEICSIVVEGLIDNLDQHFMRSVRWGVRADLFFFYIFWSSFAYTWAYLTVITDASISKLICYIWWLNLALAILVCHQPTKGKVIFN